MTYSKKCLVSTNVNPVHKLKYTMTFWEENTENRKQESRIQKSTLYPATGILPSRYPYCTLLRATS